MSEEKNNEIEMLDEYDFSQAVIGKYAEQYAEGTNIVVLEADVAKVFPDSACRRQGPARLLPSDARPGKGNTTDTALSGGQRRYAGTGTGRDGAAPAQGRRARQSGKHSRIGIAGRAVGAHAAGSLGNPGAAEYLLFLVVHEKRAV